MPTSLVKLHSIANASLVTGSLTVAFMNIAAFIVLSAFRRYSPRLMRPYPNDEAA